MSVVETVKRQHAEITRIQRGRLFRKYFLLILALVCGALLISGGIGLYFAYQENKVALASLQREKAVSAAARIEQFVKQIEQQLAFAALPQLGVEGLEQRRIEFLKLLRVVPAVTDIAQIDPRGREQLTVSRLRMDTAGAETDRAQDPAFRNARPGQTWFGPVYFRKETEPYMTIAVRSGGEQGPVTVAEVNLKFIWDVVTRIKVGQKGKAYVVDGNGYLVADPDIGLVLRKTDLSGLEQVKAALAPGADEALAMVARDIAGHRVLTAHAPVDLREDKDGRKTDPLGWKVFVEQPVAEVFQALDATIIRTVALIIAGLLLSALVAMWLARSMARPISVLQDGAQRIGAGDLETQINMKTGDELESLADQFNHMTAQLRESYSGLERKVEERTAELKQALAYQAASGEILSSISSSIADTQPVFDAITRNVVRLFDTLYATLFMLRDGQLHLAAISAEGPISNQFTASFPQPFDASTLTGKAMLSGKVMQLAPIIGNPASTERATELARLFGYDAMIVAPMVRGETIIGAIGTSRRNPVPFDDKQVALLKAFADQAVIAIENARLFNETKESLEQQTAISEVLRVISSSPTDVKPVLDAVAARAARICEAADARIFMVEASQLRFSAGFGNVPIGMQVIPLDRGSIAGRAVCDRQVMHVGDATQLDPAEYPRSREAATRSGTRTMLSVPLMRENRPLGVISLRRLEVRPFSDKQVALLKTFADQAAIAIENVRLFNETQEALDQRTATGEVLSVISGSITDPRPVFDAISRSCLKLYGARHVALFVRAGDKIDRVGYAVSDRDADDGTATLWPMPLDEASLTGRAILGGEVVHIKDVQTERGLSEQARAVTAATGVRSILLAPMQSMGVTLGALSIARRSPGGYSEREVELVRSFADQAVIAMENARLFREIQEKSAQLEVANKHKSDFLANMSHELRTPLNAIIGFSEVLMEKMFGEVNAKQADYLKDIHESGRHLLSLINDILDLSKIEAGKMELEVSTFHLPTAISNAMTLIRERAQRHSIQLGTDVDARLGEIQGDERKLKQILLNLLSNAVKFTPDGGRVNVSAKLDTTVVEIAVKDTGIGIAPEDQKLVFEEFRQVGRDVMRKAEGTGLGLALTKKFVELHGGKIGLASSPGKGSTFTITLPIRQ